MEKPTLSRIRILFRNTFHTLCADYFSLPTDGSENTSFAQNDIIATDLQKRFQIHSELRIEELTLQYMYAEIQLSLRATGYCTNELFGLRSTD